MLQGDDYRLLAAYRAFAESAVNSSRKQNDSDMLNMCHYCVSPLKEPSRLFCTPHALCRGGDEYVDKEWGHWQTVCEQVRKDGQGCTTYVRKRALVEDDSLASRGLIMPRLSRVAQGLAFSHVSLGR
jgi:hypothetical protein